MASVHASNIAVVALKDFTIYVQNVSRVLLLEDNNDSELSALITALEDPNNLSFLSQFISKPYVRTLIIRRHSSKDDEDADNRLESDEENESVTYRISNALHYSNVKTATVIIIKHGAVIEEDKDIRSQVYVTNFNGASPFEYLYSYISQAPLKLHLKPQNFNEVDEMKVVHVEKIIAQLEVGLLHFQEHVNIPNVTLLPHPIIATMIQQYADKGLKLNVEDFGDALKDTHFINALENCVFKWIADIQKVTKFDRDPSSGTVLQEIIFWLNYRRVLHQVHDNTNAFEVILTLEILKHCKRFHAFASFNTDTGLRQALTTANDYNFLMKDFPIHELLSAKTLECIQVSVELIFSHLRRVHTTDYWKQRCAALVDTVSRDIRNQLLKVLRSINLTCLPFFAFEKVMNKCFEVFSTWEDEFDKLQRFLRPIGKRRYEWKKSWCSSSQLEKLQTRMRRIRKIRRNQKQLFIDTRHVLHPFILDVSILKQIKSSLEEANMAFENVKEVDWLDISEAGQEAWEAAEQHYEKRITRVEMVIMEGIRDQLARTKNTNQMFCVISRFSPLFTRPLIRSAITKYQTNLIQCIKNDIDALYKKFQSKFSTSNCAVVSRVRDLPPVVGLMIWIKQIDFKLTSYLRRIEDVVGKNYEGHIEGQKLKADADRFRAKLSTEAIFKDWAKNVQARKLGLDGRIFTIDAMRGNVLKLKVNFLPEIIMLSKEVRNMKVLGFRVPLVIKNMAHTVNIIYPFAISLIESIRAYEMILAKMGDRTHLLLLVTGMQKETQNLIAEGNNVVWESYELEPYSQRLSDNIVNFQERFEELIVIVDQLEIYVKSLETCPYSAQVFTETLAKIQHAVDGMSLRQYSNLHIFVAYLDQLLEKILARRLQAGIQAWTSALLGHTNTIGNVLDMHPLGQEVHELGGNPKIELLVHEMCLTNQKLYLFPSIEETHCRIVQLLFAWQAIIISQERLRIPKSKLVIEEPRIETYRSLLTKLPDGTKPLVDAYQAIKHTIAEMEGCVSKWLLYQPLWDLRPDNVFWKLGDDLVRWMQCLGDVKKARSTIDWSGTRMKFGVVEINFVKVRDKIAQKYECWHKDLLTKFGTFLNTEMAKFHANLLTSRNDLESQSIEVSSNWDMIKINTHVSVLKQKMKSWERQITTYSYSQRFLERQRFQFPNNWLNLKNLTHEWSAFNESIKHMEDTIQFHNHLFCIDDQEF